MHMGIAKFMKIIEIQCTNYENPKDLKTQLENHENQENLRNPNRIMTITKIIEI